MKLRLPHKLQTAILTAFASVTFFTVGTATLGAAQGEEAPEFASFTDTGFEVSEEELEVDLGEEEEEETKEPDSAPTNHAGFNGIYECSDDADRQLANGDISESTSDTENVGTPAQAGYAGSDSALPSDNLGFTAQVTDGTGSNGSASVSLTSSVPAASVQVQPAIPAEQKDTAGNTSTDSADKIAALSAYNWPDYYDSRLGLTAPVYAPKAKLAAAGADAAPRPGYSGTILTWDNVISGKSGDLAYGWYRTTTYNTETGEFTVGEGQGGWTNPNQGLIGTNDTNNRNTLRFAGDYGQTVKTPVYTFSPLALAGFIVDTGAIGFSVNSKITSPADRIFYLGNNNTTAALSSINENFTFNMGEGNGKVYLRGTQTIDVAKGKVFTLGANNGMELTSNLNMTLAGGGTMMLRTNADVNSDAASVVTLAEDSTLQVRADGGTRTYSFNNLEVSGSGHLSIADSGTGGQGYQATVNIGNLSNADSSSAVLSLGNAARATGSVININGGSFNGEIVVRGEATAGTRKTAVQLGDATVARNAVVSFDVLSGKSGNNNVGLGIGTNVSVKGINTASAVDSTIYSGSKSAGFSDFNSGKDRYSITFTGEGSYSTTATVKNNLNLVMSGTGTQAFSGNMSAFDGSIIVTSGTLTLGSAVAGASTVSVAGGTLDLGAALTTTGDVTVGSTGTLRLSSGGSLASGGSLSLSGATLDLNNRRFKAGTSYTLATASGSIAYDNLNLANYTMPTGSTGYTLSGDNNALTLTFDGEKPVDNTLHIYLLTGQSNSMGAVKGDPASAAMLAEYASGIQMWDGNMAGSVTDPSADTANKAWNDTGKTWFTVQPQQTPAGKGVAGPAATPYEHLTGQADLRSTWGGSTVMGPEYGFSYMMEKQGWDISSGSSDLAIVKVSRDGGQNYFWDPDDSRSIYPQILDTVIKAVLAADSSKYTDISLDGLMYLQGESGDATQGNNARNVVTKLITRLQADLNAAKNPGGRLAGVSDELTVSIGDSIILGEPALMGGSSNPTATVFKAWAGEDAHAGFVYTRDLGLINPGDSMNVHYDGNSQITIGARYAYTLAQVQGLDTTENGTVRVRSQYYGDSALSETSPSLNDSIAWWQSTGDTVPYSTASMASTIAVWNVSSANMGKTSQAAETLSSDLALGGIRIEDPYSDDENPGDHKATITINNASGTHTLSVGAEGIKLQQGNLTVNTNLTATANQTWNTNDTPANGSAQQNTLNLTGTTTIASGATVTVEGASIVNISTLAGAGGLTVNGEGAVVTLTDKTAFTGATTITSGTLKSAGTDDLDITGNLTINGNAAAFDGNITADTVTLSNIATSGSQGTFDKYAGVITGTHTITLDHYTVANMDASLVTQTLVATNSTSTTIHNLTLTACEVSVESGSNVTLADSLILGDSATYTGTLNLADGLTIDVSNMTLGGTGSSVALLSTENGNLGNTDISKLSVDFGSGSPAPKYTLSMSGNNLVLTLNEVHDLIWDAGNGTWDVNNTKHWHTAGDSTSVVFNQGDNVTFENDTATATLDGNITVGNMTLNSGADITVATGSNNLTVEGIVSGAGKLTKTGNGKLTFSSEEDATLGKLTINGGTAVFNEHVTITGNDAISVTNSGTELQLLDGMSFNGTGGQFAYALNVGSSGAKAVLGGTTDMSAKNIGGVLGATIELAENANVTVLGVLSTRSNDNNQNVDMGDGSILTAGEFRSQTLTLGSNAVLNLTGSSNRDSKIVNVTGSGDINVQARTLTLSGSSNYTGNVTLSNAANLEINATNFGGKIANTGTGTITMYGNVASVANSSSRIAVNKKSGQTMTLVEGSGQAVSKVTVAAGDGQWLFAEGIAENAEGLYTDIHLGGKGLILSKTNTTVNIGSLSGVSGTTVQGDYNDGGGRVLAVHQGEDAVYAGKFTLGSSNRSVGLNKYGSGTLTLTGENTSTNALNIYEGAIKLDGADAKWSGAATVHNGGTLELTSTISSLSNTITIAQGGRLMLGNYKDSAVTAANLTLASGSILDLSKLAFDGTETGDITLIQGGIISASDLESVTLNFTDSSLKERANLSMSGNNLVLTFTPLGKDLIWDNNANDNKWSTSENWHTAEDQSTHIAFTDGDNVQFTSTPADPSPTLGANVDAGTMTVDSNVTVTVNTDGHNLTATSLTGAEGAQGGNLTKQGAGLMKVDGPVNLTVVDVQDGSVELNSTEGGSIGTLKISAGKDATLGNIAASTTNNAQGGGEKTLSGNLTLNSGSVLTVLGTDALNYDANNTITVNEGASINFSNARWTIGTNNKIVLAGGSITGTGEGDNGALDLSQDATVKATEDSSVSVPIRLRNKTITFEVSDSKKLTVDGLIKPKDAGSLIKTGTGTLLLSGANTYNTNTTINAGVLETASENALGSSKVTIANGATLKVSENLTVQGGSAPAIDNSGTIEIADGKELKLHATATGRKYNLGKVSLLGQSATIVDHWQNAEVNLNVIDGGASSKLTLISSHCSTASNFNIGAAGATTQAADAYKGTLVLADRITDGSSGRTANFNLRDGGLLDGATLQIQNFDTKGKSMINNISLQAATVKVGGVNDADASTVDSSHVWSLNSGLSDSGVATLQLTGTGNYSSAVAINSNVNLLKTGSGTQTLSGNNANMNGTVTVNAGTLVAGSANALGTGAIMVNAGGTLELTSSVGSITGNMSIAEGATITLSGASTPLSTTGTFSLAGGSTLDLSNYTFSGTDPVTLVTTTGGGTISGPEDWSSVHLTFASGTAPENARLDVQNGNLVLTFAQPEPAKDLIWDGTSNTWASGSSQHWHEDGSETLVSFTNGDSAIFDNASADATVTVSGAVTAGSVAVEDEANVTIVTSNGNTLGATSGITVEGTLVLDGTSISGTLSGDGVVVGNEIPSAANWSKSAVLGDLSLDTAGWTGTVEVSGGHKEFSAPYVVLNTINQLATENSTVRLKGVGGYFDGGTITANIELVNAADGSPAVLITAGNNKTTTFSGTISGSGDLKFDKNGGAAETFKFTGDISQWNGSLTTGTQHTGPLTVELADAADEVNAAILQGGDRRALNLKVDNDATFNNTVKVSKVEIAGSEASATFMGDTQIATLAGAGTLVVNGAGTTTTIGSGNGFTGGIDLLGGTLDLTNALTGVGAVNLGTGTTAATLKLAGGGNALGSNSTITLGNNLTFDLSNYGSLALEEGGTTSVTLATASDGITGDAGSVSLTGLTLEEGYKASLSVDNTTNLVLTVTDESEQLYWLDPSGTWTARNLWYNDDKVTRNTFQHGDSVTIVGNNYDGGISTTINMVADASARNMTVTKADDVSDATVIIQDTVNENRLAAKNLTLQEGTTLVTNTQLEVTETMVLNNNTELKLNSPKDATISANISSANETAVIIKQGDNTLTLTGINVSYEGNIDVVDGTLVAQGEMALGVGGVTVKDGAALSLAARERMWGGSLDLQDNSTVSFLGDTELTLFGSLTLGDGVTWDLSRYGFDRPAEGETTATATLITLSDPDGFDRNFGDYVINTPGIVSNASLSYNAATHSVILTYDMDSQGDLFWMGGVGNWNADSSNTTWYPSREGGQLTQFYKGDNVTFDARAAVSPVTLTEDITAGTVTVENGTHVTLRGASDTTTLTAEQIDISGILGTQVNVAAGTVNIQGTGTWNVSDDKDRVFAGELAGTGTLAKNGSGDLELFHDNSAFTGDIQLHAGSITAAKADALGTGTTIVMGDGTELKGNFNTNGDTLTTLSGANSTVSADLNINDAGLMVAGDGNTDLRGNVSGTGSLVKEGFGTATLSGNLDQFTGKVTVEQGTLALDSDFTTSTGFDLTIGSRLQLAEQNEGTGSIITYKDGKTLDSSTINFQVDGTLALRDGTYLDMSNIHLNSDGVAGVAKFDQLQAVDADSIGDKEDAYYYEFIEGIAIENLEGAGGTTYARLVRDDKNHLLYVQTFGDTNGAYWKGDADTGVGEWNRGGSQSTGTTSQWRTEQNGTTKATYNWDRKVPMSAYFFELTNSEGNTIDETTVTLVTSFPQGGSGNPAKGAGDVIIDGATKYKFISTDDNYLIMNNQYPVAIIVRSGSTAEFDFGIDASNGSWISVEKGATMIVDTRDKTRQYIDAGPDYAQLYNVTNDGTMDMIVGRTWLKHVVNNQDMSIRAYEDLQTIMASGSIEASVVYNAYGATLTMSGERIDTDYMSILHDEDVKFTNDGTIVLNGSSITDSTSGKMIDTLPVIGTGVLKTGEEEGAHAEIVFGNRSGVLFATVEQSALELGADVTTFEYGVNITDTTTVLAGKAANFYGGTGVGKTAGSLGEVALEDASSITFGPRVEVNYSGVPTGDVTEQSYDMGHVTAGADSVLTVQKGATVTMDGFNAASGVPTGGIVVGAMPAGAPSDYSEAASLIIDGPAAVDTVTVLDGTATITGRADINQIMQDGGELVLNSNSILNGVPVSAEPDAALTGGTVTGGTLKLGTGVTLEQNAVIDVRDGGAYTVSGGTGSRIDATGLELIVDRSNTLYREVVKEDGDPVISGAALANRSGFISSGDEYVKLFDMAEGTTLTAKSEGSPQGEAVYHASASGMMTLIGTDNWAAIQASIGEEATFDVQGHIGYGYLHTADLALKTYYVRDAYASENQVTLSDIVKASVDPNDPLQDPQLANVVFDKTDYNKNATPYNGTLTVDANVAVDLFSVSSDAKAAINIADGTTVTADADSPGVQGNLDLQGSGVYEIQDRNDLGANIALRDDEITAGGEWDGTVRVTGTSTDLTLEDKYVGEGADASTIEFRNWNGALDGGNHTVNGQVVLSSETPTAMKLTGEDDIAYTFTNTVSGSGNIDHAEGGNVVMTFTGDTEDWDGTYEQNASTEDSLTFTGGETVNADVTSGNGTMDLTYGGTVETVAGDVNVYSGGDTPTTMNVAYTGGTMGVAGGITSDAQSNLTLTVGDGKQATNATFTGTFAGTENATMAVQSGSTATIGTATIGTNAELLRVVGAEGSKVVVNSGSTLSLASTDPETGYSEFHDLTNEGTIEMKASGGEIHLVDDTAEGNTYNLGELVLTDPVGTATIETSGVEGKTTNVNITGLTGPKSAAQVLELTNGNGTGTVNYNLGNTDDTKELNGTIAYGGSGGVTNLVLQENGNSAASAVLETRFTSADAVATANIVVDAEAARVLGLSSDGNSANKAMKVSGREDPGDPGNRTLNITGDGNYTYAGTLGSNLDIAYTGDGSQTIEGGVENFSGKVTVDNGSAQAGVLELLNASSVNITDLTIGANDTLDLKKNDSNVGTAVVTGTMKAGGAGGTPSKLDGSLTLGSGSTYDVSASGGTGGLNLTGALTIYQGAMLSSGDMGVVWAMEKDTMYDLAFGVTDMTSFGTDVDWNQGVDASTVFGNGMKEGEYYIRYSGTGEGGHGGNVGAVYLFRVAVPEPTTSTLSLLALAALAARRRKR